MDAKDGAATSPSSESGSRLDEINTRLTGGFGDQLDPAGPVPNQRHLTLVQKKARLEATLHGLQNERSALAAKAGLAPGAPAPEGSDETQRTQRALADASGVIKEHIALLHRYNELKDIGQGLMGLIADQRGVRVAEVMQDFGVAEKD